jgi:hypothetical protein
MSFVMAQVIGRRYSAVFGFENAADVCRATGLIKKAATDKGAAAQGGYVRVVANSCMDPAPCARSLLCSGLPVAVVYPTS